jgi:Holliday junction resolvasome RuvABC endonuclease subunit
MKIMGLDLSSKTGYAIISDGKLESFGKITTDGVFLTHEIQEYNYIYQARAIANRLLNLIKRANPDYIIIEQTNLGRSRDTQKGLEFVHYAVLDMLEILGLDTKIAYVDTSAWRRVLKLKLTKEQRAHNRKNAELRRKKRRGEAKAAPKKGEGKITWKHLSVSWANEKFGLSLKLVDNDMADAIALAEYGYIYHMSGKNQTCNEFDLAVFE